MDGTVNRSSNTSQAAWVALSSLTGILISIGSAAVLSRYLAKADLGTYKQVLYIYNTLLVVFTAGLPRVYSYFLPRHDIEEGYSIVKKINRILFTSGVLLGLLLFFGSEGIATIMANPKLAPNLRIFALVPPLLMQTLGIEGVLITFHKSKFLPVYNVISRLVTLAAIILPIVLLSPKVEYAMYGWIVASVFSFLLAWLFFNIPFKRVSNIKTTLGIKQILGYSIPIVGASIAGVAIRSSDQFFISRFFGPETFAEFSNGFIQLPFIGMVAGSASAVIMPQLSKLFKAEGFDRQEILRLWQSTLVKSAKIIYPLLVLFFFAGDAFVIALYGEQYEPSVIYFRIKLFANVASIIMLSSFMLASGNSMKYMYLHVFFAVIIWTFQSLGILFFPSPIAIAIISSLVTILTIIVGISILAKSLKFKISELFALSRVLTILAHCIGTAIVAYFLLMIVHVDDLYLRGLLKVGLFVFCFLVSAYFLKIDYLDAIRPLLVRIRSKIKLG